MNCNKQNRIHVRNKSGQKVIIRCADMTSPHFAREVTSEQCEQCPRYKTLIAKQLAQTDVPNTPGLVRQAVTYTKAVAGWVSKGSPERSDEEVQHIFNTRCGNNCSWYDAEKQRCKGCGCKVSRGGVAVINKIKMASEHCPRGLW